MIEILEVFGVATSCLLGFLIGICENRKHKTVGEVIMWQSLYVFLFAGCFFVYEKPKFLNWYFVALFVVIYVASMVGGVFSVLFNKEKNGGIKNEQYRD